MTITEGLQNQLEERTARALSPAMRDARRVLEAQLERARLDNVRLAELPLDVWDDILTAFSAILEEQLSAAYIQAANEFADGLNYPVDAFLLDEAARGWANVYAYDLGQSLNQTSQERLNGILQEFFDTSMTNQQLSERLASVYGTNRTQTIAVTEVTRAAAEGQAWVARQLGVVGVSMIPIWETRLDEFVCPVCGPRHDQAQGTNWFMLPPAHPSCRCGVRYEYLTP